MIIMVEPIMVIMIDFVLLVWYQHTTDKLIICRTLFWSYCADCEGKWNLINTLTHVYLDYIYLNK